MQGLLDRTLGDEEQLLNEAFIRVNSPDDCATFLKVTKGILCPQCQAQDNFSFRNISTKRCRYPGREKSRYVFEEYELRCDVCGKLWTQLFRIEKENPAYKKWTLQHHIGTLQHWEEIQRHFPVWVAPIPTPALLLQETPRREERMADAMQQDQMPDTEGYQAFLNPVMQMSIPSEVFAFVKQEPLRDEILDRLRARYSETPGIVLKEATAPNLLAAIPPLQDCDRARIKWELNLAIEFPHKKPDEQHEELEQGKIFYVKIFAIQRSIAEFAVNVGRSGELVQRALDCNFTLGATCFLHSQLKRLQWQWQAMLYAAPDAVALLDWSQRRVLSLGWLRITALPRLSPFPPFDDIFQIVVQPDSTGTKAWLHTFGLNRFNIPELEVLEVPTDMETLTNYHNLLSTIVGLFLMQVPTENQFFLQFTDDVKVKWIRSQKLDQWTDILESTFGTSIQDRQLHHPYIFSAVLLSTSNGEDIPLGRCSKALVNSEIFVSNAKIDKYVATISQARGVILDLLWEKLQGQAVCMVKIGFPVTDPTAPIVTEFMWCQVVSLSGPQLHVRLLNKPVHVKNLKKDDVLSVPWWRLQTWNIAGRSINVDPNNTEVIANMLALNRISDEQYQGMAKMFSSS